MKKVLNITKITLEKDLRESNLKKDAEGNFIGYNQSEFTCRVYLDNGDSFFVPSNPHLAEIIKAISINEDNKYPRGLGRNMFLLAYLYPIFETYLREHGFKPKDFEFAQTQAKKADPNYDKFLEGLNDKD